MTDIEVINSILKGQGITISALAKKAEVPYTSLTIRLKGEHSQGMHTSSFVGLLKALGYDLVVVPHLITDKVIEDYRDNICIL